ncbi:MAG: hypothetical protein AAB776_04020 [Patescibacteria group bacterium]
MAVPKTFAFIDSQNLNLGTQACGWYLNFAKFRVYLKDKFKVEKAFIFVGYVAGNESLYTSLQQAGYVVIFKPTLEYKKAGQRYTKGNVDGDFHCLLEYLEKQRKLAYLILPNPHKFSALLRKFRPFFFFLNRTKKIERINSA